MSTGFPCSVCARSKPAKAPPAFSVEPMTPPARHDDTAVVWLALIVGLMTVIAHVLIAVIMKV